MIQMNFRFILCHFTIKFEEKILLSISIYLLIISIVKKFPNGE